MRSFIICTSHQILFGDKINNEIGETCGIYPERRGAHRVLVGKPVGM
jgi:hypothetical protein